jgi:hypothetical protein
MTPVENLYYALGEMIYALACADKQIQREEKENLHKILTQEFLPKTPPVEISEIIFRIFERDRASVHYAFEAGKKQFELNSHYLSPELKKHFIRVMQNVAHVYPPVTTEEREIVNDFQTFLTQLEGDPVYYSR